MKLRVWDQQLQSVAPAGSSVQLTRHHRPDCLGARRTFGRTVYCQEKLTTESYGRDHHPRCFSIWMAGGGIKPGVVHGETDEYSYNIVRDPVSIHDLHATQLHCLGIDHKRLTFKFQGRHYRLTDVHGEVLTQLVE